MTPGLTRIERISRVLLALLTGLLIWGTSIDQETFHITRSMKAEISTPPGYQVLSSSEDSVEVVFKGSGWDVLALQIGGLPGRVQFYSNGEPGGGYPSLIDLPVAQAVPEPRGPVIIESVDPTVLTILLDTTYTRSLPVAVSFTDGIPARFRLVFTEPSMIRVEGPSSMVRAMDSVSSEPVQPSPAPYFSAVVTSSDQVAYSVDSVKVSAVTPAVPSPGTSGDATAH